MFQRMIAMVLCSCMVIGNTAEAACTTATYESCAETWEEAVEETAEEITTETETTVESTEEESEAPETTEESTEEYSREPETSEESTEEYSREPETSEESTEEYSEEPETTEESTTQTAEQPETMTEGAKEPEEALETVTEEMTEETETEKIAEAESTAETEEEDDRVVAVEVTPRLFMADLTITLSGEDAKNKVTRIEFYYKEKGAENWEKISFAQRQPYKRELIISRYQGERLKENTTYEYIAGIEEDYDTGIENLTKIVKGEFTLPADERTLQECKVYPSYENAVIDAGFTGNKYNLSTHMKVFYREEGTEDWCLCQEERSEEESHRFQFKLGSYYPFLDEGTRYEYVVVMAKYYDIPDSPDEVTDAERKLTGTFETKKRNYELNIEVDEESITTKSGVLKISAKGDEVDEKLYVNLTLSNGTQYPVTLYKAKNYAETLKIKELSSNTQYNVTKVELYTEVYTKKIEISTFTPEVSFKTKPYEAVKSVNLSRNEIGLNLANTGSYTVLYATVTPENADQYVTWNTSNPEVAYVYCGKVYAKGVGEAIITARAYGNNEVTASCKVTVGNYVVGLKKESGYEEANKLTISKNESVDNLVLLQKNGDELIPVEEFDVTVLAANIAKWEKGKLTGTGEGTVYVRFEKDGIYSFLNLEVTEEPKDFVITGIDASNEKYPAIAGKNGTYEIACKDGVTYTVKGQFDSGDSFDTSLFGWTSSDETVATVEAGVITPKKAGEVVITAKHSENAGTKECKLIIKDVAEMKCDTVYALTNLKKKMCLKDLDLAALAGEGWEWKTPKTALYTLPVNDGSYLFEAVYTKDDKYACKEETVNVCIGTFTKLEACEKDGNHNHVIQTGKDEMYLQIVPEYTGTISQEYTTYIPEVKGLDITWDKENNAYKITASKEGKYVLKPEIRVKDGENEKIVLTGKYEIKAVKDAQAYSIKVTTGVTDNDVSGRIMLDYSEEIKKQPIVLKAVVLDKDGKEIETALEWKIADKTTATIKYDKKNSHQASVIVQGTGGNTTLTVKAKDAAGYTIEIPLEIRDIRPRVDKNQVTVNMAYDFDDPYSDELNELSGNMIEIVGAYDNLAWDFVLYKNDKETIETEFKLNVKSINDNDLFSAWIEPVDENIKPGTYKCQIAIATRDGDELYFYPLTIKVINKMPSVKVKMPKLNLFYRDEAVKANISISGTNYGIEEITWKDNSEGTQNSFAFDITESYSYYTGEGEYIREVKVSQNKVQVKNGKPVDKGVTKGTLSIKLYGYKKPVELKNYKINYTYKKPVLKSESTVSLISPEIGIKANSFTVYDTIKKEPVNGFYVYEGSSGYKLKSVSCDNENVSVTLGSLGKIEYQYLGTGNKEKETIVCKLNSEYWREPLEVKHTIKIVKPEAKLDNSTIVMNTGYKNKATIKVNAIEQLPCVKMYDVKMYDIEVKGTDKNAQKLIDKDVLSFSTNIDAIYGTQTKLYVQMNPKELQKEAIKSGTYTFHVIPHYTNQITAQEKTMKTLKLKVVIKDKPISVKVKAKGGLDTLLNEKYGYSQCHTALNATFSNVSTDCKITGARLTGDYAQYFGVVRFGAEESALKSSENPYYLYIKEAGKIKAGQTYKLTITYTLKTESGDTIEVSGDFKVKIKQTPPKITVSTNNVVLYDCTSIKRKIKLLVPYPYAIKDVQGGIDCNKDGENDIVVTVDEIEETYKRKAWVYVEVVNPDAVTATAKGKNYKVPITLTLKGRDGIGKDAQVNVNVKVKK